MDMRTKRSRPSWIASIYLAIENTKFFHKILNLLISVIFRDVATADTDTKASSKVQTEKPVARSIGPIGKGEMAFQRCTTV